MRGSYGVKGLALSLMLVASAGLLAGCLVLPRHTILQTRVPTVGPPPHAPAHGHRHKHPTGVELVFDSQLGVYLVVGHPHYYFSSGRYLRIQDGVWQVSGHIERGWKRTPTEKVPTRLRSTHATRKRRHGLSDAPAKARH